MNSQTGDMALKMASSLSREWAGLLRGAVGDEEDSLLKVDGMDLVSTGVLEQSKNWVGGDLT